MTLVAGNVSVTLGGMDVVREVSVALEPGQVTGLLGPNGAGKSTLMRAMAGQLEHHGTVTLGGEPVDAMDEATRARHIAWLPQTRQVSWALSVESLVALGRLPWHGWRRTRSATDQQICRAAMQMMDVEGLASRPVTELSGGEQARVLMARAVAQDTPVLLADEPAAGLDPAHQMSMMAALRQLAGKGRTVLVSLHDLSLAARWCDRIVVMKDARLAATGLPGDVMTQAMLRDVYGINAEIGHDRCGLWLAPTGLTRQGDTG
jgi:iron complex transport system ATP-binding protein